MNPLCFSFSCLIGLGLTNGDEHSSLAEFDVLRVELDEFGTSVEHHKPQEEHCAVPYAYQFVLGEMGEHGLNIRGEAAFLLGFGHPYHIPNPFVMLLEGCI